MSALTDDVCYPNSGKGLCVILANFYGNKGHTSHLPGYMIDHKDLKEYFENDLQYDVVTHVGNQPLLNLSSRQFKNAIGALQAILKKQMCDESGKFDKFIMFLLSHGGEAGLCMCEENSNGEQIEIDGDGNIVYISVEEIISYFTHDNIPNMEGIPKCFVIQACRGRGYVQAADPDSGNKSENEILPKAMENPSIKRANILVAHATLEETFSYVHSTNGSWFVNTILEVLKGRSKKDDVFGIMTKAIRTFCEKTHPTSFFPVNNADVEVQVLHDKKWCPLLIYGRLLTTEHEADNKYKKGIGMPLYPGNTSYTYFVPNRHVEPLLKKYTFTGTVTFRMAMQEPLHLSALSAEMLKPFADEKYFEICGSLKNKASEKCTDYNVIYIHRDTFQVVKYEIPKCGMKNDNIEIFGYLEDEKMKLEEPMLQNKEAVLYINSQVYHVGKLEKYNGVWGIYAPIYQLPVVSSTLTKKMYLTQPEENENDKVDGFDALIQLANSLKLQNLQKSKAPKKSSEKEADEGPKTKLEEGDIENLPAGPTAKEVVRTKDLD